MWAEKYSSWYKIIVDHEADAGTQGDRQFDGGVGGGVSCYVSIQGLLFLYTITKTCIDWQVTLTKWYWCNRYESVWAEMYLAWYEMIEDSEADGGTEGDGQSDGAVGGGVMLCLISSFGIVYTMKKRSIDEQVVLGKWQ